MSPLSALTLLRHGLINALVCGAIAAWLAVLQHGRFGVSLVYSLSIGMACWALIDGGRWLACRRKVRLAPDDPRAAMGWPGSAAMVLILLIGVPLGYIGGSLLADTLTGHRSPMPWRIDWEDGASGWGAFAFLLILSFVVSGLTALFMYVRGTLIATRAEAERVQRLASQTQLKLLQSQLEPHMLFNTLANLRVLIALDPPRAQVMLDHLIAFLRATLDASRAATLSGHTLATEFDRLADYLSLIAIRMGPRLSWTLDLPEALRSQPVPPLLLQPLVENSIRHGLEPAIDGGRITISASTTDNRLVLSVRDSGIGLDAAAANPGGSHFGLQQVRERLASLHGTAARLQLEAVPAGQGGGTLARIELPLCPPAGPQELR
jgi:signal transduction histidine kinase